MGHPILTARQREIYEYMEGFILSRGYVPSYAQICRRFQLGSKATVNKHIKALEGKGVLRRVRVDGSFAIRLGDFEPHATERRKVVHVPEPLRWEVWERDNFTCLKCGVRRCLTVDHIKPSELGGENVIENMQTLCRVCNGSKKQRTIDYRKKAC